MDLSQFMNCYLWIMAGFFCDWLGPFWFACLFHCGIYKRTYLVCFKFCFYYASFLKCAEETLKLLLGDTVLS